MGVNTLGFEQAATLLNAIRKQATGQSAIAMADERDFVTVAQATLLTGLDPVVNAIGQIVGRTIYSMRPYTAKLRGIEVSNQEFGYITRKLSIADRDFEDSAAFTLVDGQYPVPNMFQVKLPSVLQLNFYGQNTFKRHYTVLRVQLKSAFESSQALGEFVALVAQNCYNMIEQNKEVVRRATLANFIAGKIAANNGVIHLITEYNAQTGAGITATTVYDKANFDDFCKWMRARISTLSGLMTERSIEYQINVTNKEINRHTPIEDQKVYIYKPFLDNMNARVLSDTFHDDLARMADVEGVNFWQSIQTPDTINVTPVYLKADGTLETSATAVNQAGLIGVMFDREALGVTIMDEFQSTTPYECSGEYWNYWFSFIQRWWNDFTEKGLVLLLD